MKYVLIIILALFAGSCVFGNLLVTDGIYTFRDGSFSYGVSYRRTPCELCGEAISVQKYNGSNSTYCVDTASSLPLSEYESSAGVDEWEFKLAHDLCDECALLANEKIKKPLVAKYKELWAGLIETKSKEKAEREVKRKGLHIRSINEKIESLQEELKEIEGNQE